MRYCLPGALSSILACMSLPPRYPQTPPVQSAWVVGRGLGDLAQAGQGGEQSTKPMPGKGLAPKQKSGVWTAL